MPCKPCIEKQQRMREQLYAQVYGENKETDKKETTVIQPISYDDNAKTTEVNSVYEEFKRKLY
jgi:hypothetical protein